MKTIHELRLEGDARVSIHDMNNFEAALLGDRGDLDGWLECYDEEEVRLHIGKLLHLCVADLQYENQSLRAAVQHEADSVEAAKAEIVALRSRIKQMEEQEPVKIQHRVPFADSNGELVGHSTWIDGRGFDHWPHRSLYLAPGALSAPSISPTALRPVIQWLRNGCEPAKAADELEMLASISETKS